MKTCKICEKLFTPERLGQKVCSYQCSLKVIKFKKEKKLNKLLQDSGVIEEKLRRKCDQLYQEVCKEIYPFSIISGDPTEVIHHHIYKSQSNSLRYYIPNGIPLTNDEHDRIHRTGDLTYLSFTLKERGVEWLEDLVANKRVCKLTEEYLLNIRESLKEKL